MGKVFVEIFFELKRKIVRKKTRCEKMGEIETGSQLSLNLFRFQSKVKVKRRYFSLQNEAKVCPCGSVLEKKG